MNNRINIEAEANEKLKIFEIKNILLSTQLTRVRSKLGGSHTVVTYPPLDSLTKINSEKILKSISPVNSIELYQHIAFCEHMCPFCSYTTTYSPISKDEKVNPYINALIKENQMWLQLIGKTPISTLYIGGGTPTSISIKQIELLLTQLNEYNRTNSFIACSETSPLSISAPNGITKLNLLKNWGVNRLSIGIQSFNNELLKKSRGYDKECAIKSITTLLKTGLEVNIDLIQDLPEQTIEHIFEDLEQIEIFKPHQVTWYIMRLEPTATWFKEYINDFKNIENEFESIKKRLIIRLAMKELGYISMPGGRFVRSIEYKDKYKEIRSGSDTTLLGMGVSAYSHGWGYFFRNTNNSNKKEAIKEYVTTIESGKLAIQEGMFMDEEIKIASKLVKGIRTNVNFDKNLKEGIKYLTDTVRLLDQLQKIGLVEINEISEYKLSEAGFLFEEEICSLLYSASIKDTLLLKDKYWHKPN